MKRVVGILIFLSISGMLSAQSIFGKWKTLDDETGKAKSIVHVYEKENKAYAKIIELLEEGKKGSLCTACEGENKNKPIEGLIIIKGLEKNAEEWSGGKILDPVSGKEYKCYITLEDDNKLKVRGYIGLSLLGRTQFWTRVAS